MVKRVPFHGKYVTVKKLSEIYDIPQKEILFRYSHGCRQDNLVVTHISEESLYSFVKFQGKKITIKELLTKYHHLGLNEFIVRKRANEHPRHTSLVARPTKKELNL